MPKTKRSVVYKKLGYFTNSARVRRARAIPDAHIVNSFINDNLIYGEIRGRDPVPYIIAVDISNRYLAHYCPDFERRGKNNFLCKHIVKILASAPQNLLEIVLDKLETYKVFKNPNMLNEYKNQVLQLESQKLAESEDWEDVIVSHGASISANKIKIEELPDLLWNAFEQFAEEDAIKSLSFWGEKFAPYATSLPENATEPMKNTVLSIIKTLHQCRFPLDILVNHSISLLNLVQLLKSTEIFQVDFEHFLNNNLLPELKLGNLSKTRRVLALWLLYIYQREVKPLPANLVEFLDRFLEDSEIAQFIKESFLVAREMLQPPLIIQAYEDFLRYLDLWDSQDKKVARQHSQEWKTREFYLRCKKLSFLQWLLHRQFGGVAPPTHLVGTFTRSSVRNVTYLNFNNIDTSDGRSSKPFSEFLVDKISNDAVQDYLPYEDIIRAYPLAQQFIDFSRIRRAFSKEKIKQYWPRITMKISPFRDTFYFRQTFNLNRIKKSKEQYFIVQWDIAPLANTSTYLISCWGRTTLYPDPKAPTTKTLQPFCLTLCQFPLSNISSHEAFVTPIGSLTPDQVIQLIAEGIPVSSPLWDLQTLNDIVRGLKPYTHIKDVRNSATKKLNFIPALHSFQKALDQFERDTIHLQWIELYNDLKEKKSTLHSTEKSMKLLISLLDGISPKVASEFISCLKLSSKKAKDVIVKLANQALKVSSTPSEFFQRVLEKFTKHITNNPNETKPSSLITTRFFPLIRI